jgi:hypothetical protein
MAGPRLRVTPQICGRLASFGDPTQAESKYRLTDSDLVNCLNPTRP